MIVLYSIFANDSEDATAILRHMMTERSVPDDDIASSSSCILTLQYDTATATWRIDLLASAFTQELAGSCWNALIGVHVAFPRDVWLGTYDAESIAQFAPARSRVIGGTAGYVLHPSELDALLQSPVDW